MQSAMNTKGEMDQVTEWLRAGEEAIRAAQESI